MEPITLDRDEVIKIIVAHKPIIKLLKWIQSEWRLKRSLADDPMNELLHGAEALNSIIEKIESLEKDLDAYDEAVQEIVKEQEEETIDPYKIYESLVK